MKKGHIFRVILQFAFIILVISCKNKNNEIITVENVDNVNNNLSTEIKYDMEINKENICKIHNQKMYKEKKIIIIYGLIDFYYYDKYNELREKYFPNSIEETLGGCVVYDKTYELSSPYYVCNKCNKEREKYYGIK